MPQFPQNSPNNSQSFNIPESEYPSFCRILKNHSPLSQMQSAYFVITVIHDTTQCWRLCLVSSHQTTLDTICHSAILPMSSNYALNA